MQLSPPLPVPFVPHRVLLLAGHRADAQDRAPPRFTLAMQAPARERIDALLATLSCDRHDLALTQGAAGADLLLAEAALRRGVALQLLLPVPEDEFVARSILPSAEGRAWQRRYLAVKAASLSMPAALAPIASSSDSPFERCNEWLYSTARASGGSELHLVCLWDGQRDRAPGGTAHMVALVQRLGGTLHWIDTRTLH